jgi:DNA-binding PadR family transcriptional regulator
MSILGRPAMERGGMETELGVELTPAERALAGEALRDLEKSGLVRPTYRDLIEPLNWLELTQAGAEALRRDALDELDEALSGIGPHFVEMRHGAWAAVYSSEADSIRQAAHSAREMFTQILDKEAPGVTGRRNQIKNIIQTHYGRASETTMNVVESQCEAVEALYKSLHAVAHSQESVAHLQQRVVRILQGIETGLFYLLAIERTD